ncbi:hypothetical protein LZ32DRAFT_692233 [Colletotrichum eremochloae]|nr:hypothetical protein LZ32DRAFT_692233 [Colletotrichum eremochloae]
MSTSVMDDDLVTHLKMIYRSYRHTSDIDAKGAFFSSSCYQICRPNPSFAARDRDTIVGYLHDHAPKTTTATGAKETPDRKGFYTIRPLRDDEYEFGTDEHVAPAGFGSAEEVRSKALREGWVGMRVDLWDEVAEGQAEQENSLLVKVQYWWRKEDDIWIQIFHDIMYMGPRDGTEGLDGEILDSIPTGMDPCLDDDFNTTQWVADNGVLPNYVPSTTESRPIVAQRILDQNMTSETGMSYSTTFNQTSVLYMTGVTVKLIQTEVTKFGAPEDLDRSLGTGYNSAILAGERTSLQFSGRIETHNGSINLYASGAGTSAILDAPRLYSSGPGAIGLFSVRGAVLNVTDFRHCSGGFRSPTLAGLNIDSRGGVAHTAGSGSPLIYSLGRTMSYNLTGWAEKSPAVVMEGPQYVYLSGNTITSGAISGFLFFDWAIASEPGTGTLEATFLRLTVREGPAFYLAASSAKITLVNARIDNPSGTLLRADTNTVSRDLERVEPQRWSGNPIASNSSLTIVQTYAVSGDIVTRGGCTVIVQLLTNSTWEGGANASLIDGRGGLTVRIDETSTWVVNKNSFVRGLSIIGGDLGRIVDRNTTVVYDKSAPDSAWLQGRTYTLKNGGQLRPWN